MPELFLLTLSLETFLAFCLGLWGLKGLLIDRFCSPICASAAEFLLWPASPFRDNFSSPVWLPGDGVDVAETGGGVILFSLLNFVDGVIGTSLLLFRRDEFIKTRREFSKGLAKIESRKLSPAQSKSALFM